MLLVVSTSSKSTKICGVPRVTFRGLGEDEFSSARIVDMPACMAMAAGPQVARKERRVKGLGDESMRFLVEKKWADD